MPHVVIYTLPNCGRCSVLKEKLNNSGVIFESKDANEHLQFLRKHKIFSAPALMVNDEVMDFSKACKWLKGLEGECYAD